MKLDSCPKCRSIDCAAQKTKVNPQYVCLSCGHAWRNAPPYAWTLEMRRKVVVGSTLVMQFVGGYTRARHLVTRISTMGHPPDQWPHVHFGKDTNPVPWEVLDPSTLVLPITGPIVQEPEAPVAQLPSGVKVLQIELSHGRTLTAYVPNDFSSVDALEVARQLTDLVKKQAHGKN